MIKHKPATTPLVVELTHSIVFRILIPFFYFLIPQTFSLSAFLQPDLQANEKQAFINPPTSMYET